MFKLLLRSTILSTSSTLQDNSCQQEVIHKTPTSFDVIEEQTLVGKPRTESGNSNFHISLLRTRVSDLRTQLHYFADVYQSESRGRLTTMLAVSPITPLQAFR